MEIRKSQYFELSVFLAKAISIGSPLPGVEQMMIGFLMLDSERGNFIMGLHSPLNSW